MKRRLVLMLGVVVMLGVVAGVSSAGREGLWTVELSNHGLQHIIVQGPAGPVVYYYIPYEVTNKTAQAVTVNPQGKIVTEPEVGQTLMSSPDPKAVLEISKKLGRELLDTTAMGKEPLPADKTKSGVIIWSGLDDRADHLDIYLYGFTNEFKYSDEATRTGFLRKAYHIKIFRPGGVANRFKSPVEVKEEGWTWVPTDVPTTEAAPAPEPAPAPAPAPAE